MHKATPSPEVLLFRGQVTVYWALRWGFAFLFLFFWNNEQIFENTSFLLGEKQNQHICKKRHLKKDFWPFINIFLIPTGAWYFEDRLKSIKNTDKKIKFNNILINLDCYYILSSSSIFVQRRKTHPLWRQMAFSSRVAVASATYLHHHLGCSKCKAPPNHDLTLLTHVQHTHLLRQPHFLVLSEDLIASSHPENISWGFLLLAKFPPGICNWQDPPDSCQFPAHVPLPVYVSKPVLLFLLPLLFGIVVFWKCFL